MNIVPTEYWCIFVILSLRSYYCFKSEGPQDSKIQNLYASLEKEQGKKRIVPACSLELSTVLGSLSCFLWIWLNTKFHSLIPCQKLLCTIMVLRVISGNVRRLSVNVLASKFRRLFALFNSNNHTHPPDMFIAKSSWGCHAYCLIQEKKRGLLVSRCGYVAVSTSLME